MVANAWMRPGNTGASSSAEHFLEETFGIIGRDRIGLVRGDSGFCSEKMMRYFEQNEVSFIIAARFHAGLKGKMRSARWFKLKDGVEVCETRHAFSAQRQGTSPHPHAQGHWDLAALHRTTTPNLGG